MASFWSWLWDKIRLTLDPDSWIKLDRETVHDAVQIIQERLEQEAERRQVRELKIEDLSPEQRQELFRDLERILRPRVQATQDDADNKT